MKKIYLASPYSHIAEAKRQERFCQACIVAADLIYQGFLVFSPICHTHPIAQASNLPLDWNYWKALDESFLSWCDELWVLKLEGWEESKGVTAEISFAKNLNKPISYLEY